MTSCCSGNWSFNSSSLLMVENFHLFWRIRLPHDALSVILLKTFGEVFWEIVPPLFGNVLILYILLQYMLQEMEILGIYWGLQIKQFCVCCSLVFIYSMSIYRPGSCLWITHHIIGKRADSVTKHNFVDLFLLTLPGWWLIAAFQWYS